MSDQPVQNNQAPTTPTKSGQASKLKFFRVSIETTDALYFAGLFCVFGGLGSEIGWGWGAFVAGAVLIFTALWSIMTPTPKAGGD